MADSADSEAAGGAPPRTARGSSERSELGRRAESAARRAAESKATIPHLYAGRRVSIGAVEARLLAPMILAAVGRALAAVPELNASYRDGGIDRHSRINVGLVFEDEGEGPLIPTVFDADRRAPEEITAELERLRRSAGEGGLTSPELAGGTFTVSFAEQGADWLAAPVTPGQAAHLAVGRLRSDGSVELTLGCDQRAVRAPAAGRFLERVAAVLESGDESGES